MKDYTIINQVIIIFLIMTAGIYARKKGIITGEVNKGLSSILLNITLPLNIIASFNVSISKDMIYNIIMVFIFGLVIHPISFAIGRMLFYRVEEHKKKILIFISVFSNCGFMGYPILESLFGKLGILYGSIFIAPFNIYLWSMGVKLFQGKDSLKNSIRNMANPGITAVAIGLMLLTFSIKLYAPLQKSVEIIGGMTTPLSMIITGSVLGEMKIKDIFASPQIYIVSIVRLVLIPAMCLIVLRLMGAGYILTGVCTVIAAMPAAVMATVFSEKYEGNSHFASQCVFISTILSVLTIPIIVLFI